MPADYFHHTFTVLSLQVRLSFNNILVLNKGIKVHHYEKTIFDLPGGCSGSNIIPYNGLQKGRTKIGCSVYDSSN
jgi:hypothetical protein